MDHLDEKLELQTISSLREIESKVFLQSISLKVVQNVYCERTSFSSGPFYHCRDSPHHDHWYNHGATSDYFCLCIIGQFCLNVYMECLYMAILPKSTEALANCTCMELSRAVNIISQLIIPWLLGSSDWCEGISAPSSWEDCCRLATNYTKRRPNSLSRGLEL